MSFEDMGHSVVAMFDVLDASYLSLSVLSSSKLSKDMMEVRECWE